MRNNWLTIALAKGRMLDDTLELLEKAGLDCDMVRENGRKLIFMDQENQVSYILGKPMDIPTYVEYGAADLGIVGKDVLMEEKGEYYELMDLNIGYCRMVIAREKDKKDIDYSTVASKYPQITEDYFERLGRQANVIKLHGSVELAPIIDLADLIVDLVSTGTTLRETNLEEVETIAEITSRLIANKGSYQIKQDRISGLIEKMAAHVPKG